MQTSVRKIMDCRDFPNESKCSLTITGTEAEVLKAAAEHAVSSHGHAQSAELVESLRSALRDEA
jgi:predicted small metal-binding protein